MCIEVDGDDLRFFSSLCNFRTWSGWI